MEPMELLEIRNGKMVGATSGREIRLRSTNIGGWMNLEDFINGYAGTDQSIRHAMKETIGEAKATFFFDRMLDYFFTEDDVRFLKEHGLNVVRLPLNYRRRHGPRDAAPGIGVHAAPLLVPREKVPARHGRLDALDSGGHGPPAGDGGGILSPGSDRRVIHPGYNRKALSQAVLCVYAASLLEPEYAKTFKGLSEKKLDEILQSFSFNQCVVNRELAGLLRKHAGAR